MLVRKKQPELEAWQYTGTNGAECPDWLKKYTYFSSDELSFTFDYGNDLVKAGEWFVRTPATTYDLEQVRWYSGHAFTQEFEQLVQCKPRKIT